MTERAYLEESLLRPMAACALDAFLRAHTEALDTSKPMVLNPINFVATWMMRNNPRFNPEMRARLEQMRQLPEPDGQVAPAPALPQSADDDAPAQAAADASMAAAASAQAEADQLAAEEAAELERQRLERERLEAERLEAERLEAERLERERLAAERLEAERLERERLEAERRAAMEAELLKASEEQRARWEAAVAAVHAAAEGSRDIVAIAEEVVKQLHEGEPDLAPHAATISILSDAGERRLQVLASVASGREAPSAADEWLPNAPEPRAALSWRAVTSGAQLDEEGETYGGAISAIPLTEAAAEFHFGALLSGGPAVPRGFLQMMGKAAAGCIERAWRLSRIDALIEVARGWIHDVCEGDKRVAAVEWCEGQGASDAAALSLELHWLSGALLGSIRVFCKDGQKLNGFMTEVLGVTGKLLDEAVGEIERMHIGGACSWLPDDIEGADSAARLVLPVKLQDYARGQLGELDLKLIAELKSYKAPPESVYRTCLGVYCILGRKAKDLGEWAKVREVLSDKIIKEMTSFDATRKGKKKPWSESRKATKGLDSDTVFSKGSLPVQLMFKWIEVERLVRKICVQLRKDEAAKEAAEEQEGATEEDE